MKITNQSKTIGDITAFRLKTGFLDFYQVKSDENINWDIELHTKTIFQISLGRTN